MTFFLPIRAPLPATAGKSSMPYRSGCSKRDRRPEEIKSGDPEMMLHTFISALIGIAVDWASNDGCFDEKEELRKVFDTIF